MEFLHHHNFLAILTCTLIYFALGAIWYSKVMFAVKWGAYNKIDFSDTSAKGMLPTMMIVSFIMMFGAVLGLDTLNHLLGIANWEGGLKLGILCGGCFSVATMVTSYVYLNKPMGLYFIDGGYHMCGFVISGVILSVWH